MAYTKRCTVTGAADNLGEYTIGDFAEAGVKLQPESTLEIAFDSKRTEENRRMVMVARSVGASAKFATSGGAIVGTFEDEEQFTRLGKALAQIGCTTFIPTIGTRDLESADLKKSKHTSWRNS